MNQRILLYIVIFLGFVIIIGTTVVITTIVERSANIDFFSSGDKGADTLNLEGNCDLSDDSTKVTALGENKIAVTCEDYIEIIDLKTNKITKQINY